LIYAAQMAQDLLDGSAWRDFCRRLEALGDSLLSDAYPDDPRARSEGVRAITRWLTYALQQEIEAGDPRFPGFVRHQDPWNQWGGPNPDNLYLRANIDPTRSYRVWSRDARGLRHAIFSLHEGDMHLEEYGVFGERSLSDIPLDSDGGLTLWLTPADAPPREGITLPLDPRARIFTIRLYQSDWERDALPGFQIECVETEGLPRPPLEAASLAAGLDRAARWVEASLAYWNRYTGQGFARSTPNVATAPRSAPGGADNILYGSCFWQLEPGEVLLLESARPDADYWSFVSHTMPWLESGEFDRRQTSLNDAQTHVDADGMIRVVVAHEDPGAPNWIDTEGRRIGMLVYRWVWARDNPCPTARFFSTHEEARAALPADHPRVDAEARRRGLARRREAVWNRYR
jgi:hypothetical protein